MSESTSSGSEALASSSRVSATYAEAVAATARATVYRASVRSVGFQYASQDVFDALQRTPKIRIEDHRIEGNIHRFCIANAKDLLEPYSEGTLVECVHGLVDIARDPDDPFKVFVPGKLLAALKQTYPEADIETLGTRSDGRIEICIHNAKDLPEPPGRAERIDEMVAQAAGDPETVFFANDAVHDALNRIYPDGEIENVFNPPFGGNYYEFRIRNAKDLIAQKHPEDSSRGCTPKDRDSGADVALSAPPSGSPTGAPHTRAEALASSPRAPVARRDKAVAAAAQMIICRASVQPLCRVTQYASQDVFDALQRTPKIRIADHRIKGNIHAFRILNAKALLGPHCERTLAERTQELIDIAREARRPGSPEEEFRVPAKLLDRLRETYPTANIETIDTDWYGRSEIRIRNAKDLPEPPGRAERIDEMVLQAAIDPLTRFFANEAFVNALKRAHPNIKIDFVTDRGLCEFRIRNGVDLLKPPPASKGSPREMVVQAAADPSRTFILGPEALQALLDAMKETPSGIVMYPVGFPQGMVEFRITNAKDILKHLPPEGVPSGSEGAYGMTGPGGAVPPAGGASGDAIPPLTGGPNGPGASPSPVPSGGHGAIPPPAGDSGPGAGEGDEDGDEDDSPLPPPTYAYRDPESDRTYQIGELFNTGPDTWMIVEGINTIRPATPLERDAFLKGKRK